ncbi:hypothetical protein [Propioniciclava flava]
MQQGHTDPVAALVPPLVVGERVSVLLTPVNGQPTEVLGFVTDLTDDLLTVLDRHGEAHEGRRREVAALRRVPLARGRRPQATPRDLLDALADRAQAPGAPWVTRITDLLTGQTPPASVPAWGPTASFGAVTARMEGEWVTVPGGDVTVWRAAAWWATRMGARSVQVRVPDDEASHAVAQALLAAGFTSLDGAAA